MSFILDALKKSETERQQQAGGEFSNVPSSSGDQQSFKWLWILGLLLLGGLGLGYRSIFLVAAVPAALAVAALAFVRAVPTSVAAAPTTPRLRVTSPLMLACAHRYQSPAMSVISSMAI